MKISVLSRPRWSMLVLSALVVSLVGCGSGTNPVSGTVTFEGKPLAGGGDIIFVPLDGDGKPAAGVINPDDGTYTLGTEAEDDGAIAGKHRVEIIQNEVLQEEEYAEAADPGESGSETEGSDEPVKEEILIADEDRIPAAYSSANSTLTAEVKSGENSIDFDLKRTP